jgi:hypothetical protein
MPQDLDLYVFVCWGGKCPCVKRSYQHPKQPCTWHTKARLKAGADNLQVTLVEVSYFHARFNKQHTV